MLLNLRSIRHIITISIHQILHRRRNLKHHILLTRLQTSNTTKLNSPLTSTRIRRSKLLSLRHYRITNSATISNLKQRPRHRIRLTSNKTRIRDRIRHIHTSTSLSRRHTNTTTHRSLHTTNRHSRRQLTLRTHMLLLIFYIYSENIFICISFDFDSCGIIKCESALCINSECFIYKGAISFRSCHLFQYIFTSRKSDGSSSIFQRGPNFP